MLSKHLTRRWYLKVRLLTSQPQRPNRVNPSPLKLSKKWSRRRWRRKSIQSPMEPWETLRPWLLSAWLVLRLLRLYNPNNQKLISRKVKRKQWYVPKSKSKIYPYRSMSNKSSISQRSSQRPACAWLKTWQAFLNRNFSKMRTGTLKRLHISPTCLIFRKLRSTNGAGIAIRKKWYATLNR